MTPEELTDYASRPENYFGTGNQQQGRKVETAMDMFDFFVDGYRDAPKERLLELLGNGGAQEDLRAMD